MANVGSVFMAATSQHEFVPTEQAVRKVVAYSHVKSDCSVLGWTEESCSACRLARRWLHVAGIGCRIHVLGG